MKKYIILISVLAGIVLIQSCKDDDTNEPTKVVLDETPYILEYGQLPPPNIALDNPLTVQGVQLGRMLFYEKMLSKDGSMACASCHLQEFAFRDTAQFSIGVEGKPGGRQAMAVFNMALERKRILLGRASTFGSRPIAWSNSRSVRNERNT